MKKLLKNKKILIFFIIALLIVIATIFIIQSSFAIASHSTTAYYVGALNKRSSGTTLGNYNNVKVDKIIPNDYSFKVAYDNSISTSTSTSGGLNLTAAEATDWNNELSPNTIRDSFDFTSLDSECIITKLQDSVLKGESNAKYFVYQNIGTYNGKNISLRLSIIDYEEAKVSGLAKSFVGFYNPQLTSRIGVCAGNANWVQIQYEFFDSIDSTGKNPGNPVEVDGHITYNDIDYEQGVHILDNNKGIYTRSNSKLSVVELNGEPYIYSTNNADKEGLYNPESSFTELFSGKSLDRVFTFASNKSALNDDYYLEAAGGIWNTDVMSGASLEYDSDSESGKLGKAVKKGESIKYKVTYTNDDLSNSNTITIKSVLSEGLEYVKGSAGSVGDPKVSELSNGKTELSWKINMAKNSVGTLSYKAKVTDDDVGIVSNQVSISSSNGSEYNKIETLKNSVPNKSYDKDSESGKNGDEVTPGSKIKYNVKYANVYSTTKTVTITETLSKYLSYVKNSSNLGEPAITKDDDGKTTLVWTRNLESDTQETLTYEVIVSEDADEDYKLSSKTKISIEGEEEIELGTLKNKVTTEVVKKVPKKEEEYNPTTDSPGTLAVLMRDSYTDDPVKNSKYILYKSDNETIATDVHGNYLTNKITDENGVVEWNELPYGEYILKEVEPSKIFKSGFYNYDSEDKRVINSIKINFTAETDALKWFRQGKIKGGSESGEPYIEREHVQLGDLNSDKKINVQDLTLMTALYTGALETDTEKEKKKFLIAADVDGNGKCNDGNCKITRNDIKLLQEYINNPEGKQFKAFKTVYLKGSYQKRAAVSGYSIPLDLKISNLEKGTPKKLKGAKFVVKDENGNVYGNVDMDNLEESIYLPVANYVIVQEQAKNGYDPYDMPIKISMDKDGNVELLEDYKDNVKLGISDDGNRDYLEIYNKLGEIEIRVPPMEQDERYIQDTIKKVSKTTGGFSLVIAATVAAMTRYGIPYRLVLFRLLRYFR